MTTKTRNIVIIVAFLLIIFSLILSNPLRAVDEGKTSPSSSLPAPLSNLDAPGVWKLSGKGQAGPRPGTGAFQVGVSVAEREQRYGDGAIPEVTAQVHIGELEGALPASTLCDAER